MATEFKPQNLNQLFPTNSKTPQTFPELLAVYQAKEIDANIDLTGENDYRTRPGLEIRKNGATQALPGLRAELLRMLEQNAGAIFLSGTAQGVESFIGEAQDLTEGAIVILSAKEMYQMLAGGVEKGLRSDRRFSMDTINSFVDSIMKLLNILEVEGVPAPNLTGNLNHIFPDTESVAQLVRGALNSTKGPNGIGVGDGLTAIYLQQRAAEEAIKEGIATPFLPVIIIDATPEEIAGGLKNTLFFGRNVAFDSTDDVSTGTVTKVLKQLQAQHPKTKGKNIKSK
jgi:hypothetical protein